MLQSAQMVVCRHWLRPKIKMGNLKKAVARNCDPFFDVQTQLPAAVIPNQQFQKGTTNAEFLDF